MTIFITAAKKLMLQELDNSMETASAKNQSLFRAFRNQSLSLAQRELTLKLRRAIDDFAPKETDADSLLALKEIITDIDKEVENVRKKHEHLRGNLNITLTDMSSHLERFYHTISTLSFKLNDIKNLNRSFDIFCTHAAYYFGENIFYPSDEGFLLKTITSFIGSSPVSVRELKESSVLTHLKKCDELLNAIKEGEEFDGIRQEIVRQEVKAIQQENAKICTQAQPITTIPVSLSMLGGASFKAPTFKPSRGRLEASMNHVIEELDKMKKPLVAESPSL